MATKSVDTRKPARKGRNSVPKLPHELDESVGMTDGAVSAVMQQAHRDLARGLQETDRGPQADRIYRRLKS